MPRFRAYTLEHAAVSADDYSLVGLAFTVDGCKYIMNAILTELNLINPDSYAVRYFLLSSFNAFSLIISEQMDHIG